MKKKETLKISCLVFCFEAICARCHSSAFPSVGLVNFVCTDLSHGVHSLPTSEGFFPALFFISCNAMYKSNQGCGQRISFYPCFFVIAGTFLLEYVHLPTLRAPTGPGGSGRHPGQGSRGCGSVRWSRHSHQQRRDGVQRNCAEG